jgi:hypothetical protein
MLRQLLLIFCLYGIIPSSFALMIHGDVSDRFSYEMLGDVAIVNIFTNENTISNSHGQFSIDVTSGQLLEFRKPGYKVLRVRIPEGNIPSYFRLFMVQGMVDIPEGTPYYFRDYKKDSIRYHDLYKTYLEFPQLTGLDVIRHPFSAMSKRNRQIWAFQKEYNLFEQEKYIDYTFTEKLVTSLTGLTGDSAKTYLRIYRPTYEQLRSMNEYTFYSYVKNSVEAYRGKRLRNGWQRSSN